MKRPVTQNFMIYFLTFKAVKYLNDIYRYNALLQQPIKTRLYCCYFFKETNTFY